MSAVTPFSPRQPLAVNWAVFQEARLNLLMVSFAVVTIVLRHRIGAAARSGFSAVVTRGTAFTPLGPLCPATMNCRAAKTDDVELYTLQNALHVRLFDSNSCRLTGTVVCVAVSNVDCQSRTIQLAGSHCHTLPHPALTATTTRQATLRPAAPRTPRVGWWRSHIRFTPIQ